MPFRISPLKWKCCNNAESMLWDRPSSGLHPPPTQCGIHPAGPPSAGLASGVLHLHQRLQKLLPNTAMPGSVSVLERGAGCTTSGTCPALPSTARARLTQSGSDPHNPAQPQPLFCVCCGCSFVPLVPEGVPAPAGIEHLFPSPTHHQLCQQSNSTSTPV